MGHDPALHQVKHTALHLAAQRAGLRRTTLGSLAGLGRRNQNLVRRRLGLITLLERQELGPDALAELFELDCDLLIAFTPMGPAAEPPSATRSAWTTPPGRGAAAGPWPPA